MQFSIDYGPAYAMATCNLDPGDAIVALPAIEPDCALYHAPLADRHGNVFIGRKRELLTMSQASRTSGACSTRSGGIGARCMAW